MTWSARRHSKKVNKNLGKLYLTIFWEIMCDKIKKTSHVGAWLVLKGISAKIPKLVCVNRLS